MDSPQVKCFIIKDFRSFLRTFKSKNFIRKFFVKSLCYLPFSVKFLYYLFAFGCDDLFFFFRLFWNMVPLIMLLFLCSTALTQYPSFPLYPQNLPAVNGQVPLYPSLVVPGNQVYVFVNTTKLSHSQNFTKHDYVFGTKGFRDSVLLHSFVYKKVT